MGNCHSKKKTFNHVKNSVVLTRQKSDKKSKEEHLIQLNQNYQDVMKTQLSAINAQVIVSENLLSKPAEPTDKDKKMDKFFPEFKRKEYEEGTLTKKLVYFTWKQAGSNDIQTLGKDYLDLVPLYSHLLADRPLLLSLIKVAMKDQELQEEDIQKLKKSTDEYFVSLTQEKFQEKPHLLAIDILRKAMEKDGISILYNQEQTPAELQALSFLNSHLLSSNFTFKYLEIEVKESTKYSFASLSAELPVRNEFIGFLIDQLIKPITQRDMVIPARIQHESTLNNPKTLKFTAIIPDIDPNLIISLEEELKSQIPETFLSIQTRPLLKSLHVSEQSWNLWGNREFREAIPLTNTYLISDLGGRPYIKPPNGWKRLAFDITRYGEDDWIKEGSPVEVQWANCYLDFLNRTASNQGINGVVVADRVEKFLIAQDGSIRERMVVPMEYCDKWYLLLLQARVRPEKLSSTKMLPEDYSLVMDPADMRPIGLLIREIQKEEALRYLG